MCIRDSMNVDDGRVVSNFIVQALRGDDITIYGDGSQTRSFCYSSDLITGVINFMNIREKNITGPINLGNENEFSVLTLAHNILEITSSSSNIIFKDLPSDDPKQRKPDLTYAKKIISWDPKIELVEGLTKTIKYFKNIL